MQVYALFLAPAPAANWTPNSVPNAVGASATLGTVITANRSINVNSNFTIGTLTINDNNNYTLNNNNLVFRTTGGTAQLNVTNTGAHTINSGLILSNDLTINHNGSGNLSLGGIISGAGALIKNGVGTVTLSGAGANTFTNTTTINAGELRLNKTNAVALPGNVTVGDGTGTDVLRLLASNQLGDGITLTVNSSGQMLSTSSSDTIASLVMNGGLINTGTGTLTLTGPSALNSLSNSVASTVVGRLVLQGSQTVNVQNGPSATDLDIQANIVDQWYTTITKTGGGTMRLSGSNSFQGPLNINEGIVEIANSSALGASTFNNSISNGAALHLTGNINITEGSFQSRGGGPSGSGAIMSINGTNTINATITATTDTTVGSASGSLLNLTGAIDLASNLTFAGSGNFNVSGQSYGSGIIAKTGSGTLEFSGNTQDINGTRLDVVEGTVALNRPGRLLNSTQSPNVGTNSGGPATLLLLTANQIRDDLFVNVFQTGTFNLNNFNEGVAGLRLTGGQITTGNGQLSILNAGGDQIFSYSSSQTSTISGNLRSDLAQGITIETENGAAQVDLDINGVFSGAVSTVTKQGAGMLRYSGTQANTYTGSTIVEAGTLKLEKSSGVTALASTNVRVDSGATLELGSNNQISNTTGLILNGGTFLSGDTTGYSESLGTLTLTATSTIDLGTGSHQLNFENSSMISWGATLIISNWTGAPGSSGTQGQIFFGVGGLTSTQLDQITFAGYAPGAKILASGEIVPIPEAKHAGIIAMVCILLFIAIRHKLLQQEKTNATCG